MIPLDTPTCNSRSRPEAVLATASPVCPYFRVLASSIFTKHLDFLTQLLDYPVRKLASQGLSTAKRHGGQVDKESEFPE